MRKAVSGLLVAFVLFVVALSLLLAWQIVLKGRLEAGAGFTLEQARLVACKTSEDCKRDPARPTCEPEFGKCFSEIIEVCTGPYTKIEAAKSNGGYKYTISNIPSICNGKTATTFELEPPKYTEKKLILPCTIQDKMCIVENVPTTSGDKLICFYVEDENLKTCRIVKHS